MLTCLPAVPSAVPAHHRQVAAADCVTRWCRPVLPEKPSLRDAPCRPMPCGPAPCAPWSANSTSTIIAPRARRLPTRRCSSRVAALRPSVRPHPPSVPAPIPAPTRDASHQSSLSLNSALPRPCHHPPRLPIHQPPTATAAPASLQHPVESPLTKPWPSSLTTKVWCERRKKTNTVWTIQ